MIALQLAFSLRFMGRQYFSLDEVSQIGFIAKKVGWSGTINYYLTSEVTNLPAFPLLAALWYRLMPYGEGYMRLLTVILTTLSLCIAALAAKALNGEKMAYIMTALCCSSSFIMHKCSLTFRCHAFWMVFTCLTLLFYIKRYDSQGKETKKSILPLGASMAGLAWSHYFGCLVIVFLFMADSLLYLKGKISKKYIISYIIAGGTLAPWFLLMISKRTMDLSSFWPKTPTFASIPRALRMMVSGDEIVFVLLLLGIIVSSLSFIQGIISGKTDFDRGYLRLIMAIMPVVFVFGDYVYSAHINTRSGIFVLRYFLSVTPMALLTVSWLLDDILKASVSYIKADCFISYGAAIIFIMTYIGAPNYYVDVKEEVSAPFDNTYGNVREVIEGDGAEFDDKTLIAINANRANADGFEEYYLEYAGRGRDVYVMSNEDGDIAARIENADRIYIYQVMNGTPDIYTDLMGDAFALENFDENIGLYTYVRRGNSIR